MIDEGGKKSNSYFSLWPFSAINNVALKWSTLIESTELSWVAQGYLGYVVIINPTPTFMAFTEFTKAHGPSPQPTACRPPICSLITATGSNQAKGKVRLFYTVENLVHQWHTLIIHQAMIICLPIVKKPSSCVKTLKIPLLTKSWGMFHW